MSSSKKKSTRIFAEGISPHWKIADAPSIPMIFSMFILGSSYKSTAHGNREKNSHLLLFTVVLHKIITRILLMCAGPR